APRRGAVPRRLPRRPARGVREAGAGTIGRAGAVRALILAGALAVAALSAGVARAEEPRRDAPSTIAVLSAPGDRFGLRIVAELQELGFAAVMVDPGAAPPSRTG